MLSPTEKTLLNELLARAPVPEQTLTVNELMGYMFGLAITPVAIPADEWMEAIFGEDESGISARDQARSMSTVLSQVFASFMAKKAQGELHFPYQLETMEHSDMEEVFEWVSGFEEALALRPDIWEPADDETLAPRVAEELFFSMMVIQGLADPVEIMPFFEKLPDEVLAQAFVTYNPDKGQRNMQIQAFLLATLPLAVQTLQQYAATAAVPVPASKRADLLAPVFPAAAGPPKGKRGAKVIEVDFAARGKKQRKTSEEVVYQLKISLQGSKPPIWRRVQVPGSVTLAELHEIIQLSMGWLDSHLHQFRIGTVLYGPRLEDDWDLDPAADEEDYTLNSLAGALAPVFYYTYDFGDDWEHRITVEKTLPATEGKPYPVLLKGKRACPPEDCGGIWGYLDFLEAYTDPGHEEHEAVREWAGHGFDPERFDRQEIDDINAQLKQMFSQQ